MSLGFERSNTVFFRPFEDGHVSSRSPSGTSRGGAEPLEVPREYWQRLRRKEKMLYGGAAIRENLVADIQREETILGHNSHQPSFSRSMTEDFRLLPPLQKRTTHFDPTMRNGFKREILRSRAMQYSPPRKEPGAPPAPAFRVLRGQEVNRIVARVSERPKRFRQPNPTAVKAPTAGPNTGQSPDSQIQQRSKPRQPDATTSMERANSLEKEKRERERIWSRLHGHTLTSKLRCAITTLFAPDPYQIRGGRGYFT